MGVFTPNLGLYKPGGGSSGLIEPDEAADIDKLNGNSDILDSTIGTMESTLTTTQTAANNAYNPTTNPITNGLIANVQSAGGSTVSAALNGAGGSIVAAQQALGIFTGPTAPTNKAGVIWLQTVS